MLIKPEVIKRTMLIALTLRLFGNKGLEGVFISPAHIFGD
jgi:hypothetical protein